MLDNALRASIETYSTRRFGKILDVLSSDDCPSCFRKTQCRLYSTPEGKYISIFGKNIWEQDVTIMVSCISCGLWGIVGTSTISSFIRGGYSWRQAFLLSDLADQLIGLERRLDPDSGFLKGIPRAVPQHILSAAQRELSNPISDIPETWGSKLNDQLQTESPSSDRTDTFCAKCFMSPAYAFAMYSRTTVALWNELSYKVDLPLCGPCGLSLARDVMSRSLRWGWWGPASALLPVVIFRNLKALREYRALYKTFCSGVHVSRPIFLRPLTILACVVGASFWLMLIGLI